VTVSYIWILLLRCIFFTRTFTLQFLGAPLLQADRSLPCFHGRAAQTRLSASAQSAESHGGAGKGATETPPGGASVSRGGAASDWSGGEEKSCPPETVPETRGWTNQRPTSYMDLIH
jgi:hypothetical protein